MTNDTLFHNHSALYRSSRPTYPQSLYDKIEQHCAEKTAAWDCATGNGQAAIHLATLFEKVHASDISSNQIEQAIEQSNVEFLVCPAEETPFPDNHFDLVTVAQALHWFDFDKYWVEVNRVLKEGGLFCAFGYGWLYAHNALDSEVIEPFKREISSFWAAENQLLIDGYKDVKFPFEEIDFGEHQIHVSWTVDQLFDYLMSWSASQRYQARYGDKALMSLKARAVEIVGTKTVVDLVMPLTVVAGYKK